MGDRVDDRRVERLVALDRPAQLAEDGLGEVLALGVLVTGSVVIESVFAWPGTGLLAVDAVRARDFQVVQAIVIVFTSVLIMVNLAVDILYAYIDPRIRFQ